MRPPMRNRACSLAQTPLRAAAYGPSKATRSVPAASRNERSEYCPPSLRWPPIDLEFFFGSPTIGRSKSAQFLHRSSTRRTRDRRAPEVTFCQEYFDGQRRAAVSAGGRRRFGNRSQGPALGCVFGLVTARRRPLLSGSQWQGAAVLRHHSGDVLIRPVHRSGPRRLRVRRVADHGTRPQYHVLRPLAVHLPTGRRPAGTAGLGANRG